MSRFYKFRDFCVTKSLYPDHCGVRQRISLEDPVNSTVNSKDSSISLSLSSFILLWYDPKAFTLSSSLSFLRYDPKNFHTLSSPCSHSLSFLSLSLSPLTPSDFLAFSISLSFSFSLPLSLDFLACSISTLFFHAPFFKDFRSQFLQVLFSLPFIRIRKPFVFASL